MDEAHGLGTHGEERLLELLEQTLGELLLALLEGPVVAVRVPHVPHLGQERLERSPQRGNAVDGEGAQRRPVVGEVARNRLVAAGSARRGDDRVVVGLRLVRRAAQALLAPRRVVLARELPGRLHRLGPTGDEEDAVQVARRERGDLTGQLDRPRVRVRPVRVERQLAHLLERRLADLLAERIADVDREQARESVEVALPVRVLEVATVSTHDDRHVGVGVTAHPREVHPEVVLGEVRVRVSIHDRGRSIR